MNIPKLIDVTPFEPLIIKVHYDGFDMSVLEPICEKLINDTTINVDIEIGDAGSSAPNQNQPHKIKEFQPFYNWLKPITNHILKNEWDYLKQWDYVVANSWVNYHNNGGITDEHHHAATALVAATYLRLPDDGGYIEYKDPAEHFKGFHARNLRDEYCNWKQVKAVTGDVLIFPGWLRHRTQPNNSNEKRWVLTTNVMSTMNPPKKK
jgi:hypothetical protein